MFSLFFIFFMFLLFWILDPRRSSYKFMLVRPTVTFFPLNSSRDFFDFLHDVRAQWVGCHDRAYLKKNHIRAKMGKTAPKMDFLVISKCPGITCFLSYRDQGSRPIRLLHFSKLNISRITYFSTRIDWFHWIRLIS